MAEDLPFFHRMLAALLECPEDVELDRTRAQLILDSAGAAEVEAAIMGGDAYAAALWRLAEGETREQFRRSLAANG